MMPLLEDWLFYIQEPEKFNPHHFEGLGLELDTIEKLDAAFGKLPGGISLIERITDIRQRAEFNGTYLLPKTEVLSAEAFDLAKLYKDGVSDRLKELSDAEASVIATNPIEEITDSDYRSMKAASSLALLNAPMTIEDDFVQSCAAHPNWIWGLYEAIYMMTTVPEVTRYLMWPIVRYPLNDEPVTRLWLMGHRMDFCQDRSLLIAGGAG